MPAVAWQLFGDVSVYLPIQMLGRHRRTGTAVLLLALVALLFAGAASASARPFGPAEEAAYESAIDYWGLGEPVGCTTIDKQVVTPESLNGPDVQDAAMGRATQPIAGESGPCVLWIVELTEFPERLCDSMVHEVGHLHGFGHSTSPESVMTHGRVDLVPPCAEIEQRRRLADRLRLQRAWCREAATKNRLAHCWRVARKLRNDAQAANNR